MSSTQSPWRKEPPTAEEVQACSWWWIRHGKGDVPSPVKFAIHDGAVEHFSYGDWYPVAALVGFEFAPCHPPGAGPVSDDLVEMHKELEQERATVASLYRQQEQERDERARLECELKEARKVERLPIVLSEEERRAIDMLRLQCVSLAGTAQARALLALVERLTGGAK